MNWWKKLFSGKQDEQKTHTVVDSNITEKSASEVIINAPEFPDISNKVEIPDEFLGIKSLDIKKVRFDPAANQSKRRRGKVLGICLHHIMMGTFKQNVDFLKSKASGISAHYCLGRNGELTQMVNTQKKAWHCGVSEGFIGGRMRSNLNEHLVGIEIVNPGVVTKNRNGHYTYNCGGKNTAWNGKVEPVKASIKYPSGKTLEAYSVPYSDKQIKKLVSLCKAIVEKYPEITRNDIVAHYQIAQPEGRRADPFGLDLEFIRDLIFNQQ